MSDLPTPDISVSDLSYTYPNGKKGLSNVSFHVPSSSRTLLIGSNGAGKSTLLRLLAGKTLARDGKILVGGVDPFKEGLEGVTYLGVEWVLNPIVRTDISVTELLHSVGGSYYTERRDELISILDIDVDWRMHAVSDGERRRVQLAMGLVRPWSILLLDEVTVDLDCLARWRFLDWLKQETEKRGCTILYATHITDGLANWPTHLVRMTLGETRKCGPIAEFFPPQSRAETSHVEDAVIGRNSSLLDLVMRWQAEDLVERGPRPSAKKLQKSSS
ncbi:hypothetical protein AOL_s00076g334 [Orbilia oligospora ATCC 24927]|uniref:ABC transporter domain-containing protein n=2 Tax=Orbilia oligospora TaxID=2813651 RepID=G1X9M7_ARTOA|nr:hypothetical protein AOL_s00076g334 [Orbilia oligospora ATCC 24927]EGX50129.1 hypothetical protein AOL_s00076g334 [Orbilia oligospora ATCC 24927]KAF3275978.1 CCR4-NOT regulatory complex component [Orbilia oligospora]